LSSTTDRHDRGRERGQILVLFAGGIVALLIIAALAFDVGMLLVERRAEQNAADAAALAGARYVITNPAKAEAAARQIAKANGFDDADPNQVVTVHIPPIHGRYVGFAGFIEVEIEGTKASIFGGIIGRPDWDVGVMAVATNRQDLTFPFSMLALNPTACKAINVSGGGIVEAHANIQSNSNGADCSPGAPVGFSRTGGSTINVDAPDATCRVVGELLDQGSGSMTCDIAQNSFALPDPLRNLAAPAKPPLAAAMSQVGHTKAPPDFCPGATGSKAPSETQIKPCDVGGNGSAYANLAWILRPGEYPHGIAVTNGAKAYLLPGIYWLGGGGLSVSGNGSIFTIADPSGANANISLAVWGGGVMFYNTTLPTIAGGAWSLNSNGATMKLKDLDLPLTDPNSIYNHIVLFQDRTVTTSVTLNGSSSTTVVEGIIYVPGGQVKLNGNGGTLTVDQVIADTFDINGNGGTINVLRNTGVDAIISAAGLVD
jgi:putative Flp pilus-assembly TadE/G-like protein